MQRVAPLRLVCTQVEIVALFLNVIISLTAVQCLYHLLYDFFYRFSDSEELRQFLGVWHNI